MRCEICNKIFKSIRSLSVHLKAHNTTSREYYDNFIKTPEEGKCFKCDGPTNYISITSGYKKYCSTKCSANSKDVRRKYRETCLEKYGADNTFKSEEIKNKIKKTNLKNLGVENPSSSQSIKDKKKETIISNYGSNYCDVMLQKRENTNLEKYGVKSTFLIDKVKNKRKDVSLEKYGTENPFDSVYCQNKIKQMNLKKYGVEYPFQSMDIQKKIEDVNLEKYGVKNQFQRKEIIEKSKATCLEKYGVDSYSKSDEYKTEYRIKYYNDKILKFKHVKPLFGVDEYIGCFEKYKWICNECGNVFFYCIATSKGIPICRHCNPFPGYSRQEIRVQQFLSRNGFEIEVNKRDLIPPLEIDVYIPDKKIAIEYNGIYWHSEQAGKDRNYHLNKKIKCNELGVDLIHIFESEWLTKKEIMKSILLTRLGKVDERIYARKCNIAELDNNIYKSFLDDNHIQGSVPAKHKIGLYYNDRLVSAMSFSLSRFEKNKIELVRFCNKINISVIGGFGKLLSYFIKNNSYKNIITYCDLRLFDGSVYVKNGFVLKHTSPPNYFYFKNNEIVLYHRMNFQKKYLEKKLEKFDNNFTEWENMQLNNWNRIWDCGNLVFEKRII